jgi:3-hydroxybutyrate dehydrogenase
MKNKVAFITGAASGIGLSIAISFAKQGASVVIADKDAEKAIAIADAFKKQNLKITGIGCDVTEETNVIEAINYTFKRFGRLDILVNNAGLQYISPIEDFPSDQFELMIKVMLTAPFFAIKQVFPIMKKQNFGRIINMSSINGLVGFAGKAAYNSAKHGIIGLTKVAALEAADYNITVNAVCPGYVDTPLLQNQLSEIARNRNIPTEKVLNEVIYPLVPQKRLIGIDEIIGYVNYLTSENALGITGQAVVIDGGYTCQ